jgi:hypothetical protein
MNYIKHLSAFFENAVDDSRLNPSHMSLYMALFQFWNLNRFENPISINRNQVMQLSKIGSSHTYLKCLHELHVFGYIQYKPSHNPLKGSLVYLCIFDTSTAQALHNTRCKSDTSTAQALHPSLNNINIINNKTYCGEQTQNDNQILNSENMKNLNLKLCHTEKTKRKNLAAKKEKAMLFPSMDEVIFFFKSENYPVVEAQKFFNHFESNGWRVGGKTAMRNWNAAARNWMLNSKNFIPPKNFPKQFPFPKPPKPNPNNKNYSEPL